MALTLLDDIVTILVAAGVGVDNTNIFKTSKAQIPAGAGPYLTVTATGGSGPEGTHNAALTGVPAYQRPNFQILVRGQSTGSVDTMIRNAYNALVKFGQKSQLVNSVWYRSIFPLQEPFDTGIDGQGRYTMTVNFGVVKRPNMA